MGYSRNNKILRKVVSVNTDQETKDLFARLEKVNKLIKTENLPFSIGVKGGFARLMLKYSLGIDDVDKPVITDLDLAIFHSETLAKSIDEERDGRLLWFVDQIQEIFSGMITNEDIETVRYKSGKDGNIPKTIVNFLAIRDMTMNECLMVFESGIPVLYYTTQCKRDLKSRTGFLSPGGNCFRLDKGGIVSTPYGVSRLLRFLIEGKVDKVFLPEEFLGTIRSEAEGGQPLGLWGIMLCKRYENYPKLQKRMMEILLNLNLCNGEKDFSGYQRRLESEFYEYNGKEFKQEEGRSFREIIISRVENKNKADNGRRERKTNRDSCEHKKFKTERLDGMDDGYYIDICPDCRKFVIHNKERSFKVEELPSNRTLIEADINKFSRDCFIAF